MALTDFYPWEEGDTFEAADMNELVELIQEGSIFDNTTYITQQLNTNAARLTSLESRVGILETIQATAGMREQFQLAVGQQVIGLSKTPLLDTELVFLNGVSLTKDNVPTGFSGAYSLSGSTLTLSIELSSQIVATDVLVVVYRYEV